MARIASLLRLTVTLTVLLGASCGHWSQPKLQLRTAAERSIGQPFTLEDEGLSESLRKIQSLPANGNSEDIEKFVVSLEKRINLHDWKYPLRIAGKHGEWELQFDDKPLPFQGKPEWSPSLFDRVLPASSFRPQAYTNIAAGEGTGAPVVLAYENVEQLRSERAFRPGNGIYVPGTVVLEFGHPARSQGTVPVRLRILNTFDHRHISVRGSDVPLAWNTTSAVECNLENHYVRKNGLIGLLRPDKRSEDSGLFGINAFDPKKIPVIFVHGLKSSPAIWKNALNDIYNDPELCARYQPLLFMYPSGLPVPASAARLRESIQEYRDLWDPRHESRAFEQMVLVGHSMGGLLSRLQIIDSGDALWKAFFSRPVDQIPWIPPEERKNLDASLIFKHQSAVKRVVFISVPHKGSQMADLRIVQLFVQLIKLPVQAAQLATTALTEDPRYLNPALLNFHSLGLRSVDMLSPKHPYFAAINMRPLTAPFHSIIGNRGKDTSREDSSDGVVPYWSSHVEGAQSELIVPYGHSCTTKPETVSEILRILRLHAQGKAVAAGM
jgi:pimeloyl-ACP methyl ester carboxylesterase